MFIFLIILGISAISLFNNKSHSNNNTTYIPKNHLKKDDTKTSSKYNQEYKKELVKNNNKLYLSDKNKSKTEENLDFKKNTSNFFQEKKNEKQPISKLNNYEELINNFKMTMFLFENKFPLLLHFTNVENLPLIIENGLLSVNTISSLGIPANRNDPHRLDGYLNSVSLSLGFPNYKMFYKYRIINPHKNWVVLGINSNIILEKKCAFCKRNAADHRIRQKPLNDLMTGKAFEEMFQDIDGFPSRESQNLKNYYTTDPQAEILVFDKIDPKYIEYVFFEKKEILEKFSYLEKESIKFILDNTFFKKR